jgi:LytS/YehU family sensor histidine kinase
MYQFNHYCTITFLVTGPFLPGLSRIASSLLAANVYVLVLGIVFLVVAIAEILVWRLQSIRKKELEAQQVKAQMMELHDRALRAQMNPHFLFNSLNSIKQLVQESKNEEALNYLGTFTKLMRGVLQHADRPYISLHEELETCRHYVELEALRFGKGFQYRFEVDASLDLKSVEVPCLIIQPIIENAIWHGLMPKENDRLLSVNVWHEAESILVEVVDNGIGRQAAANKHPNPNGHLSKGMSLTTARIDTYRIMKDSDAAISYEDLQDEKGNAKGTKVLLSFQLT